jgi:hypothetical protein
VNLVLKQREQIKNDYGVDIDEDDEEENEVIEPIKPIKKIVPKVEVREKPQKKKSIKYVEVESSSEEEEIVYVKKTKSAPIATQQIPKKPNIVFW